MQRRKVTCTAEGRSGGVGISKVIRAGMVPHKGTMLDLELQDFVFSLVFQLTVCQFFLVILLFCFEMEEFILYNSVWKKLM